MEDEQVTNPKFTEEVLFRTPGYVSWQGNNWVAHCSDYCAFIGYVGWRDLVELGIEDQFDNYTGFSKEELDVKIDNNYSLVVEGNPSVKEDDSETHYLHKGIARRAFKKIFKVDFDMKVNEAKLENGILTVIVERIIPEYQKPHSIQISDS